MLVYVAGAPDPVTPGSSLADWSMVAVTALGVVAALLTVRSGQKLARRNQAASISVAASVEGNKDHCLVRMHALNTSGAAIYDAWFCVVHTPWGPLGDVGSADDLGPNGKTYRLGAYLGVRKLREGSFFHRPYVQTFFNTHHALLIAKDPELTGGAFGLLMPGDEVEDEIVVPNWDRGYLLFEFVDGQGNLWSRNLITGRLRSLRRRRWVVGDTGYVLQPMELRTRARYWVDRLRWDWIVRAKRKVRESVALSGMFLALTLVPALSAFLPGIALPTLTLAEQAWREGAPVANKVWIFIITASGCLPFLAAVVVPLRYRRQGRTWPSSLTSGALVTLPLSLISFVVVMLATGLF